MALAAFGVTHTYNPKAGEGWLLESILHCIASPQSVVQEPRWSSYDSRPLGYRSGLTFIGNGLVVLFIVCLKLLRCPSTISSRIRSVYVNAIECQAVWVWSHITQERLETVSPCVTHGDASPAIQRIFRSVRVVASVLSAFPCAMFLAAGTAMRRIQRDYSVAAPTPATLGRAMAKFPLSCHHGSSALTEAFPIGVMAFGWRSLDNSEALEYLSGQVAPISHTWKFTVRNPSAGGK